MITVHDLENSQSMRILWLLEELGAEYETKTYKRRRDNRLAPDEYRALHPAGTSPTVTIGDKAIAETNAIVEVILDEFPESTLRPKPGDPARVEFLYWFHATQGTFMPLLLDQIIMKGMVSNVPFFLKPLMRAVTGKVMQLFIMPRTTRILGHMDNALAHGKWLAGDTFTAADIVMGYCLENLKMQPGALEGYANIQRYIKDFGERPAFKRALDSHGGFTPFS